MVGEYLAVFAQESSPAHVCAILDSSDTIKVINVMLSTVRMPMPVAVLLVSIRFDMRLEEPIRCIIIRHEWISFAVVVC